MPLNEFEQRVVAEFNKLGQVDAGRYGIKADGSTDNTAALLDLANRFKHGVGDYRRTRIYLPERGVTCGRLPLVPGVEWWGGTLAPPPGGTPTGHLIYPADPSWMLTKDGSGANRSGVKHMHIDGRRSQFTNGVVSMPPTGITASGSTTGGALGAGDYVYVLAYGNSLGSGVKSGAVWGNVASGSAGSVTLSWANTEEYSQWPRVHVYGRTGGRFDWKLLADLNPGTTSWTDTGAAPIGGGFTKADLSGQSLLFSGAACQVEDVEVYDLHGSVVSDWHGSTVYGTQEPDHSLMEGMWSKVRMAGLNGQFVHSGPHDSQLNDIIVSHPGEGHAGRTPGFIVEGGGNLKVSKLHVWGNHSRGIEVIAGPVTFEQTESEGATEAALWVEWAEVSFNGGRLFWPNGSTSRGLVAAEGADVRVTETTWQGFSAATGAAVDLTAVGDRYAKVEGYATMPGGTLLAGGNAAKHDVRLLQLTSGGPASVVNDSAAPAAPTSTADLTTLVTP